MKVYLCGPIAGCTDEECKGWRDRAKEMLDETVDPMRRDYRGREHLCKEIVELDKLDIMQCDALLVNYDKPSVGTSMEILFAWEQHKMVVLVAKEGTVLSPWLTYHINYLARTFEQAYALLNQL